MRKTSNLSKTPDTTNVKTNGDAFLGIHKTWHQEDEPMEMVIYPTYGFGP